MTSFWARICLLSALLTTGLAGQQTSQDPMQEILRLLEQARTELEAAERHLLEATTPARSRPGAWAGELDAAAKQQQSVVETIQKILDSIPPDSGGGDSGPPPPRPDQEPPPSPQDRPREKGPEMVPKPDSPEQRPEDQGQPETGQETPGSQDPENALNRESTPPPEDPTGPSPPPEGQAYWGNLPRFLQDVFRAGEEPTIPEKYRPFWRAFQQRNRDQERR